MIFQDNDDMRACLGALRDHMEDIPEHGPGGAEAFLDMLARELRAALAYAIPGRLDTPSDCMSYFALHRGDDYVLAMLRALARVLDMRTRLSRPSWLPPSRPWSCITWEEAADELTPAFADVLSQQAQIEVLRGERENMELNQRNSSLKKAVASEIRRAKEASSRGGRHKPSEMIDTFIEIIVKINVDYGATELWRYVRRQESLPFTHNGKQYIVSMPDRSWDDGKMEFIEADSGRIVREITLKRFRNIVSELKKSREVTSRE